MSDRGKVIHAGVIHAGPWDDQWVTTACAGESSAGCAGAWGGRYCSKKDNPADLINEALEELVKERLELPGYSTSSCRAAAAASDAIPIVCLS